MVLKSGEHAIVKVQRPGIDVLVAVDLEALRTAVRWLKRWGPIRRRADVDALYDEFCRTLNMELDYLAEGRNIERFRTDFKDWETIRISKVHWELDHAPRADDGRHRRGQSQRCGRLSGAGRAGVRKWR